MAEAALDLSTTEFDRTPLNIDGKRYHFRSPDELTLADHKSWSVLSKKVMQLGAQVGRMSVRLMKDEDFDPEAVTDEVTELNTARARLALADVPEEVIGTLRPTQVVKIVDVFSQLLRGMTPEPAGKSATGGSKSNAGSSVSTEAA